ncbi:primase-helicase zinc-binding domain-containing protein [Pseudodesulfovibrio pelocollis]|uniref:primase-helicase zinc-binding domain-containing protein n=1 Tax=Pseudodesulfovibrio pelocollis TaxID=3051432 RepID=UPI00255B2007|nr:primase-helicase zinc-binding domain-containing protein [Pseudodesulfovibrio sp. SB368]
MPVALIDLVRARCSGQGFALPVGSRSEYQGPCPVCGGKDRFRVFPDQSPSGELAVRAGAVGGYWCRQCGLAGDYVQWLVEVEGWDWTKIFEFIGVEGGAQARAVESPRPARPRGPSMGRELSELEDVELPPAQWREHAQKLADASAAALVRNPHLIEWLEARGVPLWVAQAFNLGWFAGESQRGGRPPCAYRNREGWGLPRVDNANGRPKSIWIPRGLVIPNYRDNELVAVRIRRPNQDVEPGGKKYVLVAGSNQRACMITPGERAYVVQEAALDGLAVIAAGVPGVGMCSMGTLTAYPDRQAAQWLGNAVDILDALDFEPQGRGEPYGNKFRHWWGARFPQCRRTPVPVGKDAGELVQRIGLAGLKTWIESQLSPVLRVTAPAPRGRIESAPKPAPQGIVLPEPVERLRLLLSVNRMEIRVGESGTVLGCRGPDAVAGEVAMLCQRPVVREWLAAVGSDVVTGRNFMKPMKTMGAWRG